MKQTSGAKYLYLSPLLLSCFQKLIPLFLIVCLAKAAAAAVIDVTAYGAIPNDSVDDGFAIQNAINAAPDNSTIYFPQGTYLLAGVRINNRRGLTLAGDGSPLTILKRHGRYPNLFESTGTTDMLVTKLSFDANGVTSFGGFVLYDAKRITITKNHFFDSNKQPVGGYDRFSWVFGRGSIPSEDILISDNLIEDLQLEVDFGLRVRIEGNTIVRPVATAGIGVFTINDNTSAQDYTIQKNTIVDPVVSAGGIVMHLDPSANNYSTMKTFRILDNHIVYTKYISSNHASAIRLGTGDNSQATTGNVFDDIVIQNNVTYKDPGSPYDFGAVEAIIFGNSSATANFKFANINVSNNRIHYNNRWGIPIIDIRQKGVNYVESNNVGYAISADIMPPSVPTALTTTYISDNQIHLAWNASVDNIGVYTYRIYRNGSSHTYSTATSYVDKNLAPGVTYTYNVTAIDLSGTESSQSFSVTAKTTSTVAPAVVVQGGEAGAIGSPPGPALTLSDTVTQPTLTAVVQGGEAGPIGSPPDPVITIPDSSQSYPVTAGTTSTAEPVILVGGGETVTINSSPDANNAIGSPPGTAITVPDTLARPTLTASPARIPPGGTVTVKWNGIASLTSRDWIGLYQRGASNTSYIERIYVSCARTRERPRASGSCPFVVPASLPPGNYELRLLANNGYSSLATSNTFAVASGQGRARRQ